MANVTAYGGSVALVTITAPGRDVLGHDGDGLVHDLAAWRWNGTAASRWREMHRAAAQIARRRHGVLSVLAWSWEYQRRGVLHKHVVVGVHTARELGAAHTYVQALHELRDRYGFGYVDRGRRHGGKRSLEVVPPTRAARYLAKYLAPIDRETGKLVLSETVLRPDVPPLVVYVSRALTVRTNCTMRELRRVRWVFVQAARLEISTEDVHDLVGQGVDVNALRPRAP